MGKLGFNGQFAWNQEEACKVENNIAQVNGKESGTKGLLRERIA